MKSYAYEELLASVEDLMVENSFNWQPLAEKVKSIFETNTIQLFHNSTYMMEK